jgi:hypothetical protein
MSTSKQQIQDRMMQTAARFWGLPESETENSFDPIVSILMGACATELEKINGEIESTRARVLERLVQLLSPEALTGVLPAHAIAYVLPAEKISTITPEDQFYCSKRFANHEADLSTKNLEVFFSPATNFLMHNATIKCQVAGNSITHFNEATASAETFFSQNNSLPQNQLWLGVKATDLNVNGLRFYFDTTHQAQKNHFFHQLPKAKWLINNIEIETQSGYPSKQNTQNYFDIDAVLNRDVSISEKYENQIHQFYNHQFITINQSKNNSIAIGELPKTIASIFTEKDLKQIEANKLYWFCISFPEDINAQLLSEVVVTTNCFPVINRKLYDINHRLKEFINIVPLLSEESFLDIFTISDQQARQLHLRNNEEGSTDDLSVMLRHGGVGRFDKREASELVEKLLHLLREETAAFSILGNDFLLNEITSLQQTINKLDQQLTAKQLLKGTTPYLMVNNKNVDTQQTIYVKFWACNGTFANSIKTNTPLNIYSNSQFITGTAKLITTTQGGRNKLNDSEKVLGYKSALLSKQKLVTNEDIIAFCKLRLGNAKANIKITKGCDVLQGQQQGLVRTLDITISLTNQDYKKLIDNGSIQFWQNDILIAVQQHSNFFIPLRVFINSKNINQ